MDSWPVVSAAVMGDPDSYRSQIQTLTVIHLDSLCYQEVSVLRPEDRQGIGGISVLDSMLGFSHLTL